ncbi:MAG: M28 family peptidase, partial [bacterium]
ASGLMEGRDTPSRGLDITALYISTQLKLWGVKPAGDDGTYFQKYLLTKASTDVNATKFSFGDRGYGFGAEFFARPTEGSFDGSLVFVGHGWQIPSKGIDPYKGVDVKGKVLLVLSGNPKGVTFRDLRRGGSEFVSPQAAAAKLGAKAVVMIYGSDEEISNLARTNGQARNSWQVQGSGSSSGNIPTVGVGPAALNEILRGSSYSVDAFKTLISSQDEGTSGDVSATHVRGSVAIKGEVRTCQNVVGVLPGSDPTLSKEYVLYGAHYDHLGMSADGKTIYYGADDDGSGTTGELEIAHAYATGARTRRSVMFVWHSGEEKGLWGSSTFVGRPPIDLRNVVAQLNVDMIGRSKPAGDNDPADKMLSGPNGTFVMGPFFTSPELGKVMDDVNKSFLNLQLDHYYENFNDPERIFFRSDHYNYAQAGIPVIFFFSGIHVDYHKPTDTVDKIDFEKQKKISQTMYMIGQKLATQDARPKFVNNMKGTG